MYFICPPGCRSSKVSRRDAAGDPWTPLESKTRDESFNGVECVRYDPEAKRVYVSVGFKSSPTIDLDFSGAEKVEFVEIARYYDGRKAAYSLSHRQLGLSGDGLNPGAPWKGADDDQSDNYQAALAVCRSHRLAGVDRHQHAWRRRRCLLADAPGRTRSGRSKLGARGPRPDAPLQGLGLRGPRLPRARSSAAATSFSPGCEISPGGNTFSSTS